MLRACVHMNDANTTSRVIKRAPQRQRDTGFEAQIFQACRQPGASVAAIAREYGPNANVVGGVALSMVPPLTPGASGFLAASLLPGPYTSPPDIRIKMQRGATTFGRTGLAIPRCTLRA